jgi:hypothetical protein
VNDYKPNANLRGRRARQWHVDQVEVYFDHALARWMAWCDVDPVDFWFALYGKIGANPHANKAGLCAAIRDTIKYNNDNNRWVGQVYLMRHWRLIKQRKEPPATPFTPPGKRGRRERVRTRTIE